MHIFKLAAVMALLLALTRLPIAPKYLFHFDSANFALALDEFNPAKHQPQPPGYVLFVGVLKLVDLVVGPPEYVLVVGGLIVGLGALLFCYAVGAAMFGSRAGHFAWLLLLFHSAFWFGGVTNQVRVCLALASTGVAFAAWRALNRPHELTPFYVCFAALGLAAGFRPPSGLLLAPLVLFVCWRTGRTLVQLATGACVTLLVSIGWIIPTTQAVGGLRPWLDLMSGYANDQFRGSSAVWGAELREARTMAKKAFVWNLMGAPAWLWAAPFARFNDTRDGLKAAFLLVWFLPVFLFSAIIHIGDPDQALASVPAVCLAGAAVLDRFVRSRPSYAMAAPVIAVTLAVLLFFVPLGPLTRASAYKTVAEVDRRTQAAIHTIRALTSNQRATIIEFNALVTWRQLSYYFPEQYVLYLPPDPGGTSWLVYRRKPLDHPRSFSNETSRLVLLASGADAAALKTAGWTQAGPVFYRDESPQELVIGPHRLLKTSFQE